jgi:hypothetical protein
MKAERDEGERFSPQGGKKISPHLTDLCLNKGIAGLLFPHFLAKGLDYLMQQF